MTTLVVSGTLSAVGSPGAWFSLLWQRFADRCAYDSPASSLRSSAVSSSPARPGSARPGRSNKDLHYRRPSMSTSPQPLDLTGREQAVLAALVTLHAATTGQVARIVFGDQPSAERLARRHLERLARFGLVRRFPDRSRERKTGAAGHVHALTAAGLRLAGGNHGLGVRQRRSWRPSKDFLAHRLMISEFYVRLIEQEREGGATVREFRSEPDCWRHYTGPAGEKLVIRPDALARLGVGDQEVSWFVEIEMDPARRPATLAAKCRAYRRYELSGQEQRRHGVFPGMIFIVTAPEQRCIIARVIARRPPEDRSLFAVATVDQAAAVMTETELGQ